MVRFLSIGLVNRPGANPIIIAKTAKDTFQAPWEAASTISELRTVLPPEQSDFDIVVMVGEPMETPRLYGASAESRTHVRCALANLMTTCTWISIKLDC